MKKEKKGSTASRIIKRIIKIVVIIIACIVLFVAGFIGYLSWTEFSPEEVTELEIKGDADKMISEGDSLKVVTWNAGYFSLSKETDFFMDGGTHSRGTSEETTIENFNAIYDQLQEMDADVVFMQEIDIDSTRSFRFKAAKELADSMTGYQSSIAENYKVAYVPYPWPTLGKIDSGIQTFSKYSLDSSIRQSLPVPFDWPLRIVNLKRCLLINRVSIENSDKELVLINLHLEAYDDGAGKEAQTLMLKNIIETEVENGNYVIAGGDFNQSFSSVDTSAYPELEGMWHCGLIDVSAFNEGLQFAMDSTTPTCRSLDRPYVDEDDSNFQFYVINGFIMSDNIEIISCETQDLGFENSDHNPVVAEIVLK